MAAPSYVDQIRISSAVGFLNSHSHRAVARRFAAISSEPIARKPIPSRPVPRRGAGAFHRTLSSICADIPAIPPAARPRSREFPAWRSQSIAPIAAAWRRAANSSPERENFRNLAGAAALVDAGEGFGTVQARKMNVGIVRGLGAHVLRESAAGAHRAIKEDFNACSAPSKKGRPETAARSHVVGIRIASAAGFLNSPSHLFDAPPLTPRSVRTSRLSPSGRSSRRARAARRRDRGSD